MSWCAYDVEEDPVDIRVIMVSDNGVGMPEGFNVDKAPSLGLRLVRILTKQMRARLEISNGIGTQFRVYFKSQSNA